MLTIVPVATRWGQHHPGVQPRTPLLRTETPVANIRGGMKEG